VKFTASRIDLIKAIGAAVRVVERRNTIPILSNIAVSASAGELTIRATDLDIEVTTRCTAMVGAPGALTLPAQTFHDILRKLPEGVDVAIDATGPDGRAILRAGRSRFTLGTLPISDFPDLAAWAGEMSHGFDMAAGDLAAMIDQVGFAISTEETRYYLNGIHLHTDGDGQLIAVATDGHRLARRMTSAPEGAEGMPGIIIPRKAVGEMARLLDKLAEPVRLSLSSSKLRLEAGGVTLVTKLIDGTFPDYKRVIPTGNTRRAVVDAAALLGAVDRVATISSERGRAVKLSFADDSLGIEVTNPDAGSARDEIDISFAGEKIEIGFNARYLADILGTLITSGATEVLIRLDTPGSPTILQASETADLLTVLMPMRV